MSVIEQTIQIQGLTWAYREARPPRANGQPPVLLCHGLPSQSYSWRRTLPLLADAGFRAVAPDWLGFGSSDKPDARTFAYTPDAYAGAFAELIKTLDLLPCTLVVQGFLASVALRYALLHPDYITRLVIVASPITTQAKLPWQMLQMGFPLVGEMITQDPLIIERTLEGGSVFQIADESLAIYRQGLLKSSAAGKALHQTVAKLQLAQILPQIEQGLATWPHPTLLLWGARDRWLPMTSAQTMAQKLPKGEFVSLPETGHYPQEDNPDLFNHALLKFLKQEVF